MNMTSMREWSRNSRRSMVKSGPRQRNKTRRGEAEGHKRCLQSQGEVDQSKEDTRSTGVHIQEEKEDLRDKAERNRKTERRHGIDKPPEQKGAGEDTARTKKLHQNYCRGEATRKSEALQPTNRKRTRDEGLDQR